MQVSQNELWPVVAAKLGFIQFPGSEAEPAKSGPAVAQHIQNVYQRFLHGFDNMFLSSISTLVQKQPQGGNNGGQPNNSNAAQQGSPGPVAGPSNMPPTNSMPLGIQPNNVSAGNGMVLTIPPGTDPKQISELMAYARQPAEELRRQGVPERVIATVERNRTILEESLRSQQNFHGSLTKQQSSGANGNMGSAQGFQLGAVFPKTPQMNAAQAMPTASPSQPAMHPQGQPGASQPQITAQPQQPQQPQQQQITIPFTKPYVALGSGQWPTPEEMRQISQWLEMTRQMFMRERGTSA